MVYLFADDGDISLFVLYLYNKNIHIKAYKAIQDTEPINKLRSSLNIASSTTI